MTGVRHREACLGCGAVLPDAFLNLGELPLANAYVSPDRAGVSDPTYPLAVTFCPACHLVQLTHTVPPEVLFGDYAYFSSWSDTYVAHCRTMAASLVDRLGLGPQSRVLEIGSNDGCLLGHFRDRGIPVLGVEPARNVARAAQERGVPTLCDFFGPEAVPTILDRFGAADLLVGNNVLAHVPAINEFLGAVREVLRPGGVAVFEFPYLGDLLERIEFDTIYHEHVFYYSVSAVRRLAERAGLVVLEVSRQPVHGGSLRVFLSAETAAASLPSVHEALAAEEAAGMWRAARYGEFSRAVERLRDAVVATLRSLKARGKRLAAYGAPAKGNVLLNYCGIGRDLLDFTVDRNTLKQGLLLPGSRIPVYPPEELLRRRPDYALILCWNIAEEVVDQQSAYVRAGGRFLVPVPQPMEVPACNRN